jgi:hypothetical protein
LKKILSELLRFHAPASGVVEDGAKEFLKDAKHGKTAVSTDSVMCSLRIQIRLTPHRERD